MNKYNNSIIYKLYNVNNDNDDIYIGSTTLLLKDRRNRHISQYKCYISKKNNKYVSSFDIIKTCDNIYDNIKCEVIEYINCENREELRKIEGNYIKKLKDICVNKNLPGRTNTEYYNDNRECILNKKKDYYIDNKIDILQSKKGYYIDNKIILKIKSNTYYNNNKKILCDKSKLHYHKTKTFIYCNVCNNDILKSYFYKHIITKKHLKNNNFKI